MAGNGPAPTPTATLGARGSWRAKARKKKGQGVEAPVSAPAKPEGLSGVASAEWDRQVEALMGLGLLAAVDGPALVAWCEAWADFVEANAMVQAEGKVIIGASGQQMLSPWYRVRRESMDALLKFAQQFGFTPAARVRVKAEGQSDAGADKGKARFFKIA